MMRLPASEAPRYQLEILRFDGSAEVSPLPAEGEVVVGRADDCDVVVVDASVSRQHVRLRLGASPSVEDLGSANGTQLLEERASERSSALPDTTDVLAHRLVPHKVTPLPSGAALRLGAVVVRVRPVSALVPTFEPGGRVLVETEDPAMQALYQLAARVADSTISVLILGETGVGKEVLASAIHRASPRADRPFLGLNCAAFAEQLLESELFGYEKGAFTGATQSKLGLLETAQGGTVLLDELGEMPLSTQAKLLRVLEDRQVMPVGGLKARPIDVRFLAATNKDLEREIERGTFRGDLYFRLNGISLHIPPLRERRAEILPLARALLAERCRVDRRPVPALDEAAQELLLSYRWPGNVRELRNIIERAVLLCNGAVITPAHLPADKMSRPSALPVALVPPAPSTLVHESTAPPPSDPSSNAPITIPSPALSAALAAEASAPSADPALQSLSTGDLKARLEEMERERILQALEQCGGNQTQAAKMLGISRGTLIARLDTYGVPRPRKPR